MITLQNLAAGLTAITVIVTFIVTCLKLYKKVDKWVQQKDKHDRENRMDILRLVIMSHEMPLSERIAAGDQYVNVFHGNGGVKKKYEELLIRYANEHKE